MAAGLLRRPEGEELEEPGLLEHADDDHHPEEKEDDVPVDAGVLGEERGLRVDQSDDDHAGDPAERGGDAVDALGRDEGVGDDEDRQGCGGEDHAAQPASRP